MQGKRLALLGVVVGALTLATPAAAQTGGTGDTGGAPAPTTAAPSVSGAKAKLTKKGLAIAPASAPDAVKNAIAAGNSIRKLPYRWGGGHASFDDTGYDCSGAVSRVLGGAGLLSSPMPSGPFMTWGAPGKGNWITVFANQGHMYAVVAGLRFDTSAMGSGSGKGPRWRATKRSPKGYAVRHYPSM